MNNKTRRKGQGEIAAIALVGIFLVLVIGGIFWAYPAYNVYSSRMAGEAELAQATYNRQISVQEANAKLGSAKLLAEADVERAKGVAASNKLIGTSLENNGAYLKWLYIDKLGDNQNKVMIYVPTEAGLPILESGRAVAEGPLKK